MPVKLLSADSALSAQLSTLYAAEASFCAGLVIGQRTTSADLVVHLAPTPDGKEDEEEEEEEEGKISSIDELDVPWMLEHFKQIVRMLPGGIAVLGAFFACSTDPFPSTAGMTHVRKLMRHLAISQAMEGQDLCVIHVDKAAKKVNAKMVDTAQNAGNSLRNVEFKLETQPIKWQKVEGSFLLDVPVVFNEKEISLLEEKINIALEPLKRCVDKATMLFDRKFRPSDEFLDPKMKSQVATKGKKDKNRSKIQDEDDEEDEDEVKTTQVEILLSDDIDSDKLTDCEMLDIHARMKLSGKMYVCSFLHSKATVAEAADAIKIDLLRSIKGRCQMHCDSLVGEEQGGTDEKEVLVVHEPPRRILIRLPHSPVCISDYLFPGETPYDSNESVEELFGFKPDIAYMDDELEMVASPRETLGADSSPEPSRPASPPPSTRSTGIFAEPVTTISIVVGITAVIVGVYLAYVNLFAGEEQKQQASENIKDV